ncbi:MAG: linear amide C-N hydrolase [Roseburia sp.]|nr:linear amide C-N hydrolase [Roseburia sp.]
MMKKTFAAILSLAVLMTVLSGCGRTSDATDTAVAESTNDSDITETDETAAYTPISLTSEITELKDGFFAVRYEGDYGFDEFLTQGGASSDSEVVAYLSEHLLSGFDLRFLGDVFGCSTIAASGSEGEALFGRNFDWNTCEAMVVASIPENGYASISTVNMDFITQGAGGDVGMALRLDEVRTLAALYAPLDGMNEAGLAVSVNMIQDSASINQDTEKPDITTTTAVRLLLNQAATVDEALVLLEQYDLHASMNMMIHFALADKTGRSVVVEYINNEMVVTETPVVTNFYLAKGDKYGIGTSQSHERYEILTDSLSNHDSYTIPEMRDALDSVSKDNFEEFASTEWSAVFNLDTGVAHYWHRENYENQYTFAIREG